MIVLLVLLILAILLLLLVDIKKETFLPSTKSSKKPGKWFNILCSFYGDTPADDNGIGAGGVRLHNFPYTRRVSNFGRRKIYPVAIPTEDVPYYKYAILEIRNGKKRIFAQVVDECGDGDCGPNKKTAREMNRKLIDIHATAFKAIGENDGLQKMKARVITRGIKPDSRMNSVLTEKGKKRYVPKHWK
jgi:hypothetical protein